MKKVFSSHSLKKLDILEEHGFSVKKRQVKDVIRNPDKVSKAKKGRRVCQKVLDEKHVLRIIYEERDNQKRVITLYPARRGGMKIDYDRDTDIMMMELSEEKIDHAEEADNIIVHLSENGKPALLEILDFSDLLPKLSEMTKKSRGERTIGRGT